MKAFGFLFTLILALGAAVVLCIVSQFRVRKQMALINELLQKWAFQTGTA